MTKTMIKKISKISVVFLVVLGISFSNVPFYVLSGMIEGYIKTANIVDRAWHLSQDGNVVDKFASYRNLARKIQIKEVLAQTSFIGNSNIIYTNGGVPTAITPHASTIDGDLLVFYHYSRATGGNETVTLPSGFTSVFNSVTANYGLVAVGWRIKQSGDTTFTATVTNHTSGTSGETIVELIQTYSGTDATTPIVNYTASLSTWASSLNLGPIAAPASATVTNDDMVVVFGGKFENVTGQTLLTGDSLTWTIRTTLNTTLGLDAGGVIQTGLNASGSDKTVTAKTVTATGVTQTGSGRMFIIKKVPATTTLSTGTNPGNSTIAPGGGITSANGFTLTTNTGTDPITSITVNLSTNSGVGTLTITNGADTVLGSIGGGIGTGIVTGSNAISI
ncbi:MAG: hypothetical protein Q8N56_02775, partial [bacterium]|nr:hypothetical protein [bacterium]